MKTATLGGRKSAKSSRFTPAEFADLGLDSWRAWLREHRDDPELIALCDRLGKALAGGERA